MISGFVLCFVLGFCFLPGIYEILLLVLHGRISWPVFLSCSVGISHCLPVGVGALDYAISWGKGCCRRCLWSASDGVREEMETKAGFGFLQIPVSGMCWGVKEQESCGFTVSLTYFPGRINPVCAEVSFRVWTGTKQCLGVGRRGRYVAFTREETGDREGCHRCSEDLVMRTLGEENIYREPTWFSVRWSPRYFSIEVYINREGDSGAFYICDLY